MLLFSVLLWLHIFSAVGWLGAAMLFGMVIGPTIGEMSPGTRAEIVVKIFPRFLRYVTIFALMTVAFGLALVADLGVDFFSTTDGSYIKVGAGLALIAVIVAVVVIAPATRKMYKLTEEMLKNSTPPTPELAKVAGRLRIGATTGLVLLILTLIFMVAGVAG